MQKVFYTSMKHDFTEIEEKWGKQDEVKAELEEAKEFYAILQSTVEKRDTANGTNMVAPLLPVDLLKLKKLLKQMICLASS